MPTAKTYVHVDKFGVKSAFDKKYAASLPKIMRATAEKALNRSKKLTTKKPGDKKAEGFYLKGTLVKLERSGEGRKTQVNASVSLALATWPRKSMFAFPSASAKLTVGDSKSLDADIEHLVTQVCDAILSSKVVKVLEKRVK